MVSSVTLRATVNWKSNALANQVNLDMLVCLKIIDLLYMTCNIQFVFVKRWSIFCNYRTVFELQQYPWVLTIVVSHQNLEIISIFTWAKQN